MSKWSFFYLVRIEFLGFRYHGWQKQPGLKSVHGMIDKTMSFVLEHDHYKTLGCGRTDAKVSADDYAFELFVNEEWELKKLLYLININLPPDIRAKSVELVDSKFNVIQDVMEKEYHYHFTFGDKPHPFKAPFLGYMGKKLDINKMQEAASIFIGTHNFKRYVRKPSANTKFEREIIKSQIELSMNPEGVPQYVYKVGSSGFMRYQVRLMMWAIADVGRGNWSINDLKNSLINDGDTILHAAPASGLVLHSISFYTQKENS